jgi:nucleoside 2-deoxyribosyltransferase
MVESMSRVFVGGPIQKAINRTGAFDTEIRQVIETVLDVVNKANYQVLSAHVYERFGEMDVQGQFREVCARDYKWMQECDLFIAIFPLDSHGKAICTSGTSVELGWASAMGKPIILVRDPAPKYSHLIMGLDVVTQVMEVYINEQDFETLLCQAMTQMLASK